MLTASNATTNELLVLDTSGTILKRIPTQGQGGVAVVNFGLSNVSIFERDEGDRYLRLERVIPTLGSPVCVAFGNDHLYVLTTTHVESHRAGPWGVMPNVDGQAQLLHGDASAAQVGVLRGELVFTPPPTAWPSSTRTTGAEGLRSAGAGTTRAGVPFGAPSPARTRDPRRMNLRWKAPSPPGRDASQRRTEDA